MHIISYVYICVSPCKYMNEGYLTNCIRFLKIEFQFSCSHRLCSLLLFPCSSCGFMFSFMDGPVPLLIPGLSVHFFL